MAPVCSCSCLLPGGPGPNPSAKRSCTLDYVAAGATVTDFARRPSDRFPQRAGFFSGSVPWSFAAGSFLGNSVRLPEPHADSSQAGRRWRHWLLVVCAPLLLRHAGVVALDGHTPAPAHRTATDGVALPGPSRTGPLCSALAGTGLIRSRKSAPHSSRAATRPGCHERPGHSLSLAPDSRRPGCH